jgi:uncharacterized protein (TIGR00730 family)
MSISSITVFCGSKSGNNPAFEAAALALGTVLAKQNIKLIYGGGNKGMMGAVANGCLQNGGYVVGIIPELLLQWEHGHDALSEMHVVADMHVRKKMLYEMGDAAAVLAGGYGTLDELFEMVTWNQLSIHNKKIYIVNTAGFYDALILHLDTMQRQGFLYDNWQERIVVVNSIEELAKCLR